MTVTTATFADRSADPAELGIDPDALAKLTGRVRRDVDSGLLPSAQFAVARDGKLAAFVEFRAGDETGDGSAVEVAAERNRYVLFSITKAITAGAALRLIGEGSLDVSKRVVEYLPEFGSHGKDVITVEQLMLHQGGFPRAPMGSPEWKTAEGRRNAYAEWTLEHVPGEVYEYHTTAAHWVVAEIIETLTGEDYHDAIRRLIIDPCRLDGFDLGGPRALADDVTQLGLCGSPATPDELEAVLGIRELPASEANEENLLILNIPMVREIGIPGGGGVATAADLALYYQQLLHDPQGLWDPAVLDDARSGIRNRLPDIMFKYPAMRTLAFVTAGDDQLGALRGFGRTTSPRAFGHNGAGGQIAWADPESGLSFCYLTNGLDLNVIRQFRRGVSLSSLAGELAV